MAIEPVKIPQNVDVEDHIIGPVTLRQLFLCLAGGGVSYVIFAITKKAGTLNFITGILSWMPLFLTAAFSFIKINGISLFRFAILMAEKSEMPAVRYWQTRTGIHINPKNLVPRKTKDVHASSHSQEQHDQISALSNVLDSGPILDRKEEPDAEMEPAAAASAVSSPQNNAR